MDKKKMAEQLASAMFMSAKGHGVKMSQEQAKGMAANLVYCIEEELRKQDDELHPEERK